MKSQNHFQFEHEKSKRPVTKVPRYKVKYTKEKVKQISQEIPEEIPAKLAQTTIQDMPATTVQPSTYTPLTVQIPNPIVAPQPRLQITGGVPQTQQPRLQITGANRPQLPRLQITDGRLYPTVEPWEDVEIPYQRMYPTVEPYSPGEMPSQRMYPTVEPYTPLKVEVLPTPTNPIVSPDRSSVGMQTAPYPISEHPEFFNTVTGIAAYERAQAEEQVEGAKDIYQKELNAANQAAARALYEAQMKEAFVNEFLYDYFKVPREMQIELDGLFGQLSRIEGVMVNGQFQVDPESDYNRDVFEAFQNWMRDAVHAGVNVRRLDLRDLENIVEKYTRRKKAFRETLQSKREKRKQQLKKQVRAEKGKAPENTIMRDMVQQLPSRPAPTLSQRRRPPRLRIDTSAPIVSNMGQGSPETPPYAPTTPAPRNRIPLRINTTQPKVPRRGRQSPKTPPNPPTTPSFPFEQPWILAEPNRRFNTSDVSTANVVVGPRRRKQRK